MRASIFFILSAATSAYAASQPTLALAERAVNCNKVNAALNILKILGPPATSFCSSYIHIPATATVTSTVVPKVVTVTASTLTVSTILPGGCPASVSEAPAGKRSPSTPNLDKRINLPALSAFAASQLSSGCSCLGLSPKTTHTTTFTPPATKTTSITATSTVCATCVPNLAPCSFDDPGACCSQACAAAGVLGNTNNFPACVDY